MFLQWSMCNLPSQYVHGIPNGLKPPVTTGLTRTQYYTIVAHNAGSCCVQSDPGTSQERMLGDQTISNGSGSWYSSSEATQTQDRLLIRIPSPSPFSSMEPVAALQSTNLSGKFSPPPFSKQGDARQTGHHGMPRMSSLASGGHRKRQLSMSSMSLDKLDAE